MRVSVLMAGAALVLASLSVTTVPAQAVVSGPTSCTTKVLNNFGAWPAAYAVCTKGGGKYKVRGVFANLASDRYVSYGPCVSIGQTSKVSAAGLFDTAVSADWARC